MSRELPPGNGVPQLQNLNALLAYSDMATPMHMQNGGGPMNGNSYSNGSQHRKNDYVDSGIGEWDITLAIQALTIEEFINAKKSWEIDKEKSQFDFSWGMRKSGCVSRLYK